MNSYKTFSARSAPQIQQRSFDITANGTRYKAHGVKGANGEWMLETYSGEWIPLGQARKQGKFWELNTETGTIKGRTLTEVIVASFSEEGTA
jgi:hypothetical protein